MVSQNEVSAMQTNYGSTAEDAQPGIASGVIKKSYSLESMAQEDVQASLSKSANISQQEVGASIDAVAVTEGEAPTQLGGSAGTAAPQLSIIAKMFIFVTYPFSVWFILATEFCERFAFYGFKSILAMYFNQYLKFSENSSTIILHTFIFGAYLTPLFGAWISDGYLGRFYSIFLLCLVYLGGQGLMAFSAIASFPMWFHVTGAFIGLFLVAIGTGGIKPSVGAFGADQFVLPKQAEQLASFFAVFYMAVNTGSTLSTVITPVVREKFGPSVAFSIPSLLLSVALLFFVTGRCLYRVNKPSGDFVSKFIKVITHKLLKFFTKGRRQLSGISRKQEYEVSSVLRVLPILCLLPFFFSLYDQHASRFVFQAKNMDRNIFGIQLTADQITVLNPVLVILLTPIFDRIIYPIISKVVTPKPLRRIPVGFFFAILAFIASGTVQIFIELSLQRRVDDPNAPLVHVSAQLVQFVLLACAEILVMISMLDFMYSQAPKTMKSVLQAMYNLSVALGNAIVVVFTAVSEAEQKANGYRPFKIAIEFYVFAALMFVVSIIFIIVASRFKSRDPSEEAKIFDELEKEEKEQFEEERRGLLSYTETAEKL